MSKFVSILFYPLKARIGQEFWDKPSLKIEENTDFKFYIKENKDLDYKWLRKAIIIF